MRRSAILALGAMVMMGGCATHSFVPAPGTSADNLSGDTSQCHMLSEQATPTVASTLVAAGLSVIGVPSDPREDAIFTDCMQAHGWRVADQHIPLFAPAQPAPAADATTPVATNAPVALRRKFGVRVMPVADMPAYAAQLSPARGLVVMGVEPGGAAAAAGFAAGDVILGFGAGPFMTAGDLQAALADIPAGGTVTATIWRDKAQSVRQLEF